MAEGIINTLYITIDDNQITHITIYGPNNENQFTMLRINFTIDLNKIVDCNFDSKIRHMQNFIKLW